MKRFFVSLVLFLLVFLSGESNPQWVKSYNYFQNFVSTLASDGPRLYAGSIGGVFISENKGSNWTSVSFTDDNIVITSFAMNENVVLAGTSGKGIFLSMDKGKSWKETGSGLGNLEIKSVVYHKNLFFAAVAGEGIFYSADNGNNWMKADSPLSDLSISVLASIGDVLFAGSDSGIIYSSSDNAKNWKSLSLAAGTKITSLNAEGSIIYAGTLGQGVFKSTDIGANWRNMNNGLINGFVTSLSLNGSRVFASDQGMGVYFSSDGGENWRLVNSNFVNDSLITSLAFCESSIIAGTLNSGVFISSDNGRQWNGINTGLTSAYVNVFMEHNSDLFAGTRNGGVLRSSDNGNSWTAINNGLSTLNVASLGAIDSTLFAGTYNGLFISGDYGQTWSYCNRFTSEVGAIAVNGNDILVTEPLNGVCLSRDKGKSWTYLGLKDMLPDPIVVMDSLIITGSSFNKGIFKSNDYGKTWQSIGRTDGYSYSVITSIVWSGKNLIESESNGVFVTQDTGKTWKQTWPMDNSSSYAYSLASRDSIVLSGTYDGVFISTDYGMTWRKINIGLGNRVNALGFIGDLIFAGESENGIFRRSIINAVTNVKKDNSYTIKEFNLKQNYPNPFNPVTMISYSIPESRNVKLVVYDMLGKEVSTLVNGVQEAGTHSVQFNGSHIPSGIYIYRIQAGRYSESRKMMILK